MHYIFQAKQSRLWIATHDIQPLKIDGIQCGHSLLVLNDQVNRRILMEEHNMISYLFPGWVGEGTLVTYIDESELGFTPYNIKLLHCACPSEKKPSTLEVAFFPLKLHLTLKCESLLLYLNYRDLKGDILWFENPPLLSILLLEFSK